MLGGFSSNYAVVDLAKGQLLLWCSARKTGAPLHTIATSQFSDVHKRKSKASFSLTLSDAAIQDRGSALKLSNGTRKSRRVIVFNASDDSAAAEWIHVWELIFQSASTSTGSVATTSVKSHQVYMSELAWCTSTRWVLNTAVLTKDGMLSGYAFESYYRQHFKPAWVIDLTVATVRTYSCSDIRDSAATAAADTRASADAAMSMSIQAQAVAKVTQTRFVIEEEKKLWILAVKNDEELETWLASIDEARASAVEERKRIATSEEKLTKQREARSHTHSALGGGHTNPLVAARRRKAARSQHDAEMQTSKSSSSSNSNSSSEEDDSEELDDAVGGGGAAAEGGSSGDGGGGNDDAVDTSAVTAAAMEGATMSSWLFKRSGSSAASQSWRRAFCVVHAAEEPPMLRYYALDNCVTLVGTMALVDLTLISCEEPDAKHLVTMIGLGKKKHMMILKTPSTTHFVTVKSIALKAEFIATLGAAVDGVTVNEHVALSAAADLEREGGGGGDDFEAEEVVDPELEWQSLKSAALACGFMLKKNSRGNIWKRRFFILSAGAAEAVEGEGEGEGGGETETAAAPTLSTYESDRFNARRCATISLTALRLTDLRLTNDSAAAPAAAQTAAAATPPTSPMPPRKLKRKPSFLERRVSAAILSVSKATGGVTARRNAFNIVTASKTLQVNAESLLEKTVWLTALAALSDSPIAQGGETGADDYATDSSHSVGGAHGGDEAEAAATARLGAPPPPPAPPGRTALNAAATAARTRAMTEVEEEEGSDEFDC